MSHAGHAGPGQDRDGYLCQIAGRNLVARATEQLQIRLLKTIPCQTATIANQSLSALT